MQCQVLYLPPLKVISCTLPNHIEDKTTLKILKTKLHIDFWLCCILFNRWTNVIVYYISYQTRKVFNSRKLIWACTCYLETHLIRFILNILLLSILYNFFFICCNMTICHILYIFYRENTCINIIYMQCKWSLSFRFEQQNKPGNKQPHFLLQIQMVFGSVAERKAPAARKIDAEEFYKYVYIRYILVFSAFTSIFI